MSDGEGVRDARPGDGPAHSAAGAIARRGANLSVLRAVAFLAFVSLGLPDGVLGVAWPSVRHGFGIPVSALGALVTTSMLGYLFASFVGPEVVRRVGVGRVLVGSSLLILASLGGYAVAPAWGVMVALGLLAGLGGGAVDAGLNAYAAEHFTPRVMTWLHACYGVGATLGPVLMTGVLSAGASWRVGYGILAGAIAGMTVCFVVTRRMWDADGAAGHAKEQVEAAGLREAVRRPAVWLGVAMFFLYVGLEVSAGQWVYSLLTESRGAGAATAGACISAYWASLTIGRIVFGALAHHVSPRLIVRGCLIGIPVATGLVWQRTVPAGNFAGLALLGFLLAPVYPLLTSETPSRVGKRLTLQSIGMQVTGGCLGTAILSASVGLFAKPLGLEAVGPSLFVMAVMLLATHEAALIGARRSEVTSGEKE